MPTSAVRSASLTSSAARISPSSIARVDDARIERGIVVAQFLDRAGAGDARRDPGDQHFEVERLGDDVVGARGKPSTRAVAIAIGR